MVERSGGEILGALLRDRGVSTVFGLPGTQNQELLHALHQADINCVVASSETAAAMMANGFARASGKAGVIVTIPGPGFTFALPGLAEAALDHTPIVHLVSKAVAKAAGKAPLQYLNLRAICEPFVKAVLTVHEAGGITRDVDAAFELAERDPRGPVVIEISDDALSNPADQVMDSDSGSETAGDATKVIEFVCRARRPLAIFGRDAAWYGNECRHFVSTCPMPFILLPPARGLIDELSPWHIPFELAAGLTSEQKKFLASADAIVTFGLGGDHNETGGYQIEIPPEKWAAVGFVNSGAAASVNPGNSLGAVIESIGSRVASALGAESRKWDWKESSISLAAKSVRKEIERSVKLPQLRGSESDQAVANILRSVSAACGKQTVVTVDSGLHQVLARVFFAVRHAQSFIFPTEFQSMGFAISAAIGALATRRFDHAAVIIGDGGLWMSGMEIATAAKLGFPITIFLLNDTGYGLIRRQQIERFGESFHVDIPFIDWKGFAESLGARYVLLDEKNASGVAELLDSPGVKIAEIQLTENPYFDKLTDIIRSRKKLKRLLGPSVSNVLRRVKKLF